MGRKNQQVWFTVSVSKEMSDAITKALNDINSQPGQVVKISRNALIKNLLVQFLVGYRAAKEAEEVEENKEII